MCPITLGFQFSIMKKKETNMNLTKGRYTSYRNV